MIAETAAEVWAIDPAKEELNQAKDLSPIKSEPEHLSTNLPANGVGENYVATVPRVTNVPTLNPYEEVEKVGVNDMVEFLGKGLTGPPLKKARNGKKPWHEKPWHYDAALDWMAITSLHMKQVFEAENGFSMGVLNGDIIKLVGVLDLEDLKEEIEEIQLNAAHLDTYA